MTKCKCIFLDRDGVINYEGRSRNNPKGYMWSMADLYLLPGAIIGVALLNEMGYKTIGITNQSGVGRGLFTEEFVNNVHTVINTRMARGDAHIDDWFFCPHHPTEALGKYKIECDCRKPKPGMIFSAAKKYNINILKSYLIGDGIADIKAAWYAGVKPILVLTGNGEKTLDYFSDKELSKIVYIGQDLLDAAQWIYNKEI